MDWWRWRWRYCISTRRAHCKDDAMCHPKYPVPYFSILLWLVIWWNYWVEVIIVLRERYNATQYPCEAWVIMCSSRFYGWGVVKILVLSSPKTFHFMPIGMQKQVDIRYLGRLSHDNLKEGQDVVTVYRNLLWTWRNRNSPEYGNYFLRSWISSYRTKEKMTWCKSTGYWRASWKNV